MLGSHVQSLQDFDLVGWGVDSLESGSLREPVWAAGWPGVGKRALVCHSPGLGGPQICHSPLLATDIMLLYCVTKEGRTGTSNDPGIPGVHVEGVRESCVGAEKRNGWVCRVQVLLGVCLGLLAAHLP